MRPQHLQAPEAEAPACKCCGREYDAGAVTPIGILEGAAGEAPLILYQCRCHTTRAVSWTHASGTLKEKAREAQRMRANPQKGDDR